MQGALPKARTERWNGVKIRRRPVKEAIPSRLQSPVGRTAGGGSVTVAGEQGCWHSSICLPLPSGVPHICGAPPGTAALGAGPGAAGPGPAGLFPCPGPSSWVRHPMEAHGSITWGERSARVPAQPCPLSALGSTLSVQGCPFAPGPREI